MWLEPSVKTITWGEAAKTGGGACVHAAFDVPNSLKVLSEDDSVINSFLTWRPTNKHEWFLFQGKNDMNHAWACFVMTWQISPLEWFDVTYMDSALGITKNILKEQYIQKENF